MSEAQYTEIIECLHCLNKGPMQVVGSVTHLSDDNEYGDNGDIYEVAACPACKKATVRVGFWHDGIDSREEWIPHTIFPTGAKEIGNLPAKVLNEYKAAEQVLRISANAYAVLLGRVLDVVCQDRNANGNTLYERLSDLATKGEIPENLVAVAHSLRQLRNVGAHAELGDLKESEVPVLSALCRAVLEYVYSAPMLVKRAEKLVEAVKKKPKKKATKKK